jgi:hypothetical protein
MDVDWRHVFLLMLNVLFWSLFEALLVGSESHVCDHSLCHVLSMKLPRDQAVQVAARSGLRLLPDYSCTDDN